MTLDYVLIENKWKSVSACCGKFGSLVSCLKTENEVKSCLSAWVTLCPNMAERCRQKKSTSILYCLSTLFLCTLKLGISPISTVLSVYDHGA